MSHQEVTCNNCGWIGFAVSRAFAEEEGRRFREYYAGLSTEQKENYRDGEPYHYRCFRCGKAEFHPTTEEEGKRAMGCTISPVVWEAVQAPGEGS